MKTRFSIVLVGVWLSLGGTVWSADGYSIVTTSTRLKAVNTCNSRTEFTYSWTAPAGHSTYDYLIMLKTTQGDVKPGLRFSYVPAGTGGTVLETLPSSLVPGDVIEIRYYSSTGQRLVTSAPITVVDGCTTTTIPPNVCLCAQ